MGMEETLKQVLAELTSINGRIEKLDNKVDKVAIEVAVLHEGQRELQGHLFKQAALLGHLEKQVERIDVKIDRIEGKLTDKIENRDNDYNGRFLKIEQAVEELRQLVTTRPPAAPKAKKKAR